MTKCDRIQNDELLEKILDAELADYLKEEKGVMTGPFLKLNTKIVEVIDSFSMVRYIPLNINDEETQENIMMQIDNVVGFLEHQLPKENYPDEVDPDQE